MPDDKPERFPLVERFNKISFGTINNHSTLKHVPVNNSKEKKRKSRTISEDEFIDITCTGSVLEDSLGCNKCHKEGETTSSIKNGNDYKIENDNYGDFHTIDWQRDLGRDRIRQNYLSRQPKESTLDYLKSWINKCSGWLSVFLVGIGSGSLAAFVDIGTEWMKDLKEGICPEAFWLNKEQCCWSSNTTFYEGDVCPEWKTWGQFSGYCIGTSDNYILSYIVYVLCGMAFAVLAAILVKTICPYASGSGIPEIKTILSGFIIRGYMGKWALIIKSIAMILAVASGLSLGKEGPLVHVACCIGNIVSYWFSRYGNNEAKKRELLSAAAAAGVSVAFGAPIGGVLFSLEEASYYFPLRTMWRSFFCALVAAFVLRTINPFGRDHLIMFYISNTEQWAFIELVAFIFIGIVGGIIGTIFIKANLKWCKLRKTTILGKYPVLEVLVITLISTALSFPNKFSRMNTKDLIKQLFSEYNLNDVTFSCGNNTNNSTASNHLYSMESESQLPSTLGMLSSALVLKIIITIFTFGIKLPAGLFIPSMAMGAIMGRIVGIGLHQLTKYENSWFEIGLVMLEDNPISPGLYAMVGAAATLGGVTRMTVSLVVIMFELTGNVNYILPLMTAVLASKWVADALGKEGIYDGHIYLNEYPYLDSKEEEFAPNSTISDVLKLREPTVTICAITQDGTTVEGLKKILDETNHNGYPIVVSKSFPYLVGFVLRKDLGLALDKAKLNLWINEKSLIYFTSNIPENIDKRTVLKFNKLVDMAPVTISDRTPIVTVVDMFCKLGLHQILVINDGKLTNLVTKKDILAYIRTRD